MEDPANSRGRAVFLDRDGTMIDEVGHLNRVADISLFPWTIDAIRAFNHAGFAVVVVTNQSAIARGKLTEDGLAEIHQALDRTLVAGGARIAAYYYCPHHPEGSVAAYATACDCRKPAPGLVARAARELNLDPTRSFVVGDKWVDVGLARAIGAKALLVRTGLGSEAEANPEGDLSADAIVDNIGAAASWILATTVPEDCS